MKKLFGLVVLLIFTVTLSGCTSNDKIVIASKPMTEQYIIVEMLVYLIEQETDIEVEHLEAVGGGTSNIHPAMLKGDIDIYPEYTGTGWMFVLEQDLITDSDELYEEVKKQYLEEFGIVWSGLYGFNNTYGIAVKEEVATMYNLETYSDLARESEHLVFGAEYDFFEREDGYDGIVNEYNLNFKSTSEMDIGLKYQAIGNDDVDVINVFSTDGRLEEYGLVVLEDDKAFYPTYYAASLIRQETLNKYPELEGVLEMLTGLFTDEDMSYMNYLVEVENKEPKDVAYDFLVEKGLVS